MTRNSCREFGDCFASLAKSYLKTINLKFKSSGSSPFFQRGDWERFTAGFDISVCSPTAGENKFQIEQHPF